MYYPQGSWLMGQAGAGMAGLGGVSPQSLSFNQGSIAPSLPDMTGMQVNNPNLMSVGNLGEGLGALDVGRLAVGGLQTLAGLWNSFQANKLAKQQFRFQKDFAQTNLTNSVQDYNTKLEDRIRSRSFTEGRDGAYADSYLEKNRLSDNIRRYGKPKG